MKIIFINNLRLPTEKAHGYQIVKMAEAYARLGQEVELIFPTRNNRLVGDLFAFYQVEKKFRTREIKMIDLFKTFLPSVLAYRLMSLIFLLKVKQLDLPKDTVVISRNPEIIWYFSHHGFQAYYDVHNWPIYRSLILKWCLRKAAGLIANSEATAEEGRNYGINKIIAAPNGVELNDFTGRQIEVAMIKEKFNLNGKITLVYAGHFYNWKGVDTLIKAMKILPTDKYTCLLVGAGPKSDQKNIITIGQVPHYEVASYLLAADIFILPTAPVSAEAERYTSPLKLFEYLAAGRAIIASDLPSSRAVVSEREAGFFKAGDSDDLAKEVERLAEDEGQRKELGIASQALAREYTWAKRASKIISFISV